MAKRLIQGPAQPVWNVGADGEPGIDIVDRIDRLVGRISNYDVLAHGTLAALGETVEMNTAGLSTVGIGISGAGWAGTIVAEITVGDGVWAIVPLIDELTGAAAVLTTVNGNFLVGIAGALRLRIRAFAWGAGTATVYLEGTSAPAGVFLSRSIPTGVNAIGTVGLDAGEAHVGQVGGNAITITVNPVLTVAGAYAAGDFVGTSATALVFANAARVAGGSGVIKSAMLIDAALQSAACELWLFDTAVTPPNDNAAWTISDADAATCIGVIPFTTYYASALNSVANGIVPNGGIGFSAVATTIWGCIVTRGAPTYASLNLTLRLSIMQD